MATGKVYTDGMGVDLTDPNNPRSFRTSPSGERVYEDASVIEAKAMKELEPFIGGELWQITPRFAKGLAKSAAEDPAGYAREVAELRAKAQRCGQTVQRAADAPAPAAHSDEFGVQFLSDDGDYSDTLAEIDRRANEQQERAALFAIANKDTN